MDPRVAETMATVGNDLADQYRKALIGVATTGGDEAARAAALKAIKTTGERIERLRGYLAGEVLAGRFAFARWGELAKLYHDELAYYVADVGNWSWSGLIADTISATARTVAQKVSEAPDAAFPWLLVVVIGLVALLLLRLVG